MTVSLVDLVQVGTSTSGTGTMTLGSAAAHFRGVSALTDGASYDYRISDGTTDYEVGTGVYSAAGTTLTRAPIYSSNANAAINLSGSATVTITALSATLNALNPAEALFFGDGSDGNLTLSGAQTLTRDMYYNNVTLTAGAALNTAGYRLFVSGILDLSAAPAGAIYWNGSAGNAASGATGGTVAAPLPNAVLGGAPGNSNAGPTGTSAAGAAGFGGNGNWAVGGAGGASGAGGTGVNAGGASAAASVNTTTTTVPFATTTPPQRPAPGWVTSSAANLVASFYLYGGLSGSAGASGGGDGASGLGGGGGGSGSGGGVVFIYARTINRGGSTAAGAIQAKGGVGGAGGAATGGVNAGGGGGAGGSGGGWVYMVYRYLTGVAATGVIDVTGGNGGAGGARSGTGVAGSGGASGQGGRVQQFNLGDGTQSTTAPVAVVAGAAGSGATPGAGGVATTSRANL